MLGKVGMQVVGQRISTLDSDSGRQPCHCAISASDSSSSVSHHLGEADGTISEAAAAHPTAPSGAENRDNFIVIISLPLSPSLQPMEGEEEEKEGAQGKSRAALLTGAPRVTGITVNRLRAHRPHAPKHRVPALRPTAAGSFSVVRLVTPHGNLGVSAISVCVQ
ncbi:hypothetical protein INR49_024486 [Caranx melampygus]|nr:hypothetical protein INR49_024486 [Caranx melampygus]